MSVQNVSGDIFLADEGEVAIDDLDSYSYPADFKANYKIVIAELIKLQKLKDYMARYISY